MDLDVLSIDKSKFYIVGLKEGMSFNPEVAYSLMKAIREEFDGYEIHCIVLPFGLNEAQILTLDDSVSKDLLEMIQKYKHEKTTKDGE